MILFVEIGVGRRELGDGAVEAVPRAEIRGNRNPACAASTR
jgi:hypothetical protein